MADAPVRFAGLRGTLAAFAVDLFAGRVGSLTDAPMCSGGYDRPGIYDGAAWHLGAASDYAGNVNGLSYLINGTTVIDASRNVLANEVRTAGTLRIGAAGDMTPRNIAASGWLTINGATRAAWDSEFHAATYENDVAVFTSTNSSGGSRSICYNTAYVGGRYVTISAYALGTNQPRMMQMSTDGTYRYYVDNATAPTAGAPSALSAVWSLDRFGQLRQRGAEPVASVQYTKTADTTIGPSATAKASLLNGGIAAGGFAAVSEPAGRWNVVGAQSDIHLKGTVSSVANQVLVFELYRNGASVATLTLPARTYGTRTPWRLEIDQDVRVAETSGTVRVDIRAYVTADNATSQVSCYQMDSTLTGVDLTVAATWDVVCTIPNNAANSITCIKARKVG